MIEADILAHLLKKRQTLRAGIYHDPYYYERLVKPDRQIYWLYGRLTSDVDYTESPREIKQSNGPNYSGAQWSWFMDGVSVIGDDIPVFDFAMAAQQGKVSELPPERISDLDCRVVDAHGDGWELKVWIVPTRGSNFAKYEMTCDADVKRGRARYKTTVDAVEFAEVEHGRQKQWIVRTAQFRSLWAWNSEERVVDTTITMSRPRVMLDIGADDKAFDRLPIPDGTQVSVTADDEHGVPHMLQRHYVWADGKPIAVEEPKAITKEQ